MASSPRLGGLACRTLGAWDQGSEGPLPVCRCALPSCVYSGAFLRGAGGHSSFFVKGHQPYVDPSLPFVTSYSALRSPVSCASQIQVSGFWWAGEKKATDLVSCLMNSVSLLSSQALPFLCGNSGPGAMLENLPVFLRNMWVFCLHCPLPPVSSPFYGV